MEEFRFLADVIENLRIPESDDSLENKKGDESKDKKGQIDATMQGDAPSRQSDQTRRQKQRYHQNGNFKSQYDILAGHPIPSKTLKRFWSQSLREILSQGPFDCLKTSRSKGERNPKRAMIPPLAKISHHLITWNRFRVPIGLASGKGEAVFFSEPELPVTDNKGTGTGKKQRDGDKTLTKS